MWFRPAREARRTPSGARPRTSIRPRLEALEDRSVPAAGALDPTFGTGGTVLNTFRQVDAGSDAGVRALVIYPATDPNGNAGKVLAAGFVVLPNTTTTDEDFALLRYNPDGTPDPTFGTNGVVTTDFEGKKDCVFGAALDAAGRAVVSGYATHPLSSTSSRVDFAVARYTAAGHLDSDPVSGFGPVDPVTGEHAGKVTTAFPGGGATARAVAVQPDGKVVAGGFAYPTGGNQDFALARYNPDGTLDASFGSGGLVTTPIGTGTDYGRALALQTDGKILLAGSAYMGTTADYDFALARYNANGTLDAAFGSGGKVITPIGVKYVSKNKQVVVYPTDEAAGLALDAAGRPVLAGYMTNTSGARDAALVRYTTTGQLDAAFGGTGKVVTDLGGSDEGRAVAIQPDGKLVLAGQAALAGSTTGYDFVVARFTAAGAMDASFGTGGMVTTSFAAGAGQDVAIGVALQADGKIVAGGYASVGAALARYLGDPPAAPTNLAAVPASSTQIDLAWTQTRAGVAGYTVERSTDGVSFAQVATVDASAAGYSDTGLSPNTRYYYRIRAFGPNGVSAYTAVVSALTLTA